MEDSEAQQIELKVEGVKAHFIGDDDSLDEGEGTSSQHKGPLAFFDPNYTKYRQAHLAQFFLDHGAQLGQSWLMSEAPLSLPSLNDDKLPQKNKNTSSSTRVPHSRPIAKFPDLPPLNLVDDIPPEKIHTMSKRCVSSDCMYGPSLIGNYSMQVL